MASTRFCNACRFNSTIDSGTIMPARGKHCPMYDFFIEKLREENAWKRSKANMFRSGHGYLRMRGWPTGLPRFVQSRWRSSPSVTWQTYPGLDSIDSPRIHREKVAKIREKNRKFALFEFQIYQIVIPIDRYGGWSLFRAKDEPLFVVWYNNKGHHALPSYLSALNEAILRASGVHGHLTTLNHPLKLSSDQLNRTTL